MPTLPGDRRYTRDHHWVRVTAGVATVGLTDYGQRQVGWMVRVRVASTGELDRLMNSETYAAYVAFVDA